MSRRWRLAIWLGLSLVVLLIGTAVAIGLWGWHEIFDPYQGYSEDETHLEVPRGVDAGQILLQLEKEGILANAKLARFYLVYKLGDPPLKAGEYRFSGPLSTPEVLLRLARGEVVTHPVTIIEGLTLEETAQQLGSSGFGDPEQFVAAMRSPRLITDLDPQAPDLEGYLFPETYQFARGTTEEEIVATMVATFRQRFEDSVATLLAGEEALPLRQLVTLASIVEKEAQLATERPVIAGVYTNRLRRRMPLQADPTVIFALRELGTYDGNLRRTDLEVDSPYNTYVYPGLPPGPIASPGLASLEAAARPADVPYLYFVSRNDGSHVFAETLSEHNRNVYKWQKLYWRQRWAEERRQEAQDE